MADIDSQDNYGETPLCYSIKNGTTLEIIKYLLRSGSNVHIRNFKGQSLFHVAAKNYHSVLEATDLLLEYGASLKAIDNQGSSVLHEVLKNSSVNLKIIQKLLKCGAQPDHRDEKGYPPLAYCKSSNLLPEEKELAENLLIQYSVLKRKNLIPVDFDKTKGAGDSVICFHFCQDNQKRTEWFNLRDACINEILQMGKINLNHSNLNDFLDNFIFERGSCFDLSDSDLQTILVNLQCKKFHIYQEMLISAIEKYDFVGYIDDCFVKSISSERKAVTLSSDCVMQIIEFLSKKDLINLILAYCKFCT